MKTNYLPEGRTCRICKETAFGLRSETGMVKYSVRHNAHWSCFLKTKGADGLRSLSAWQVGQAPYFLLKEHGLLQVAEEIRREAK
jgi:hypothetical protein